MMAIAPVVVPAKAGTHDAEYAGLWNMGSRFRGNDSIARLQIIRSR
jgi:hypothetical protein